MTVNAIIAEYNPLHKGHEYLIQEGKKQTGADVTIVVMSGDFVERGEPAIMNKYLRSECAILSGADLVLELPTYYALSSAENFAGGAVALLDSLGVVDNLIFGCEFDNIELLKDIAFITLNNKERYDELIKENTSNGLSYAKAEANAVKTIVSENTETKYYELENYSDEELNLILSSPNTTLAICYIRALVERNSNIEPVAIKRIVSDYNDLSLGALSASAVRKELIDENYNILSEQLSPIALDMIKDELGISLPISVDDYSSILIYKLRTIILGIGSGTKASSILALTEYADVSEALASRIVNNINEFRSFSQFIALLKTKNMTYAHISRALMHIVLNIKKSNLNKYIANDYALYARILAFKKESSDIFNLIKKYSSIPLVSKLADLEMQVDDPLTQKLINENTFASELYESIVSQKFNSEMIPEYSRPISII